MFGNFLEELKQKEIRISFSAGKIKYSGPEENITPDLIRKLKIFKGDLIRHCWPDKCKDMIAINPAGTKTPIVIVYCNSIIYNLGDYFGPDQPIYGFFDEGWLTGRKNFYPDVESIAREYINQLKIVLPNGPYLIGGHSLGGNLAYEMATQLQKSGDDIPLLFLLDSKTPFANKTYDWSEDKFHVYRIVVRPFLKKYYQYLKIAIWNCLFLAIKSFPGDTLRRMYIVSNYLLLLYKSRPEKFCGDLLLFRAEEENSSHKYDYGWGDLVNRITFVNLNCTHETIVKDQESIESVCKGIDRYLYNYMELKQNIS